MANSFNDVSIAALKLIGEIETKVVGLDAQLTTTASKLSKMLTSSGSQNEVKNQIKSLSEEMLKFNKIVKSQESQITKLTNVKKQAAEATIKETNAIKTKIPTLNQLTKANRSLKDAYVVLKNKQKQAANELRRLTVEQGKNTQQTRRAQKEYDKYTQKVNQANKATSNFNKTGLGGAVRGFKNLLGAFGVIGGATLFASFARSVFETTKTLDGLNFAMRKIIPSNYEYQQTLIFLKDTTKAYGTEIVSTTERYIKFLAAAKQSGLSLTKTEKIFGTVTKAAGVLGLKTDELTGVYLALEQMLSKGKVSTEELRRQLGERLPGAFGIMAQALGVTVSELDGMLKKGEILSAEALPKFADALEKAYGIESVTKVETLTAAQARLANAWIEFISDLSASEQLRNALDYLAENLGRILNLGFKLVKGFLAYKLVVISLSAISRGYTIVVGALAAAKLALAAGTARATVAMKAFNLVTKLNPIGILVSVLGLAVAAWVAFKDGVIESSKALKLLEKQMYEASKAIVENQIKILDARIKTAVDGAKTEADANKKSLAELDKYESEVLSNTYDLYTDKAEMEAALEEGRIKKQEERAKKELDNIKTNTISAAEARQMAASGVTFRVPSEEETASLFGTTPLQDAQKELLAEIERRRSALRDIVKAEENAAAKKIREQKEKDAFELNKRILEIQIEAQQEKMDNEDLFLEDRLAANREFLKLKKELIVLEADFEASQSKGRAKKLELIELEKNNNLVELTKEVGKKTNDIIESDFNKKMAFYDKVVENQERNLDKELTNYQNLLISQGLSREDIDKKVLEKTKEIRKKDLKNLIENELAKLDVISVTADNMVEIESRRVELQRMLSDLNLPDSVKIEKATTALTDFFQTFQDDFFSEAGFDKLNEMFLTLDEDGISKITKLLKESEDDWSVYFNSITEVAQEAFNFLNSQNSAYFDKQYEQLEKQKEIALLFAGESAAAKEQIEAQYEARRKAIQDRQARAQKKEALFNIAIDTAQAVVAALATGPKGIPLAFIVGAIGAAQLAMVAATPVPEFFRGTMNAPEGWAMVDEKRPEIHTDNKGNVKSAGENKANMRYLNRGDKIYSSHEEYFNKELGSVLGKNDIMPYNKMFDVSPMINIEQGDNSHKLISEIRSLKSVIANKESGNVSIDKNGIKTYISKGHSKSVSLNNRVTFKGTSV